MDGQLGRVLVGGKDGGAGFALGPRLVVTANHVVRGRGDKPVVYVPAGGDAISVERVQPDTGHDAAILWLTSDVAFFPASVAVRGAGWRVESPQPGENDPPLHGTVTTARTAILNASGQQVEMVQLEVREHLGEFGGYSGNAVLDVLGRAVLALLVEQKPVRTRAALGEQRAASNVLYAVPIGDVIAANSLPVQTSRPLRFNVGLASPGMVARPGLLDEAIGRVTGTDEDGHAGARLVVFRGPPGAGKTVLARQVADDARVWSAFPDGIVMFRAGQEANADSLARQLQETLGYRDRDLVEVLAGQRLLLIVDDIWDRVLLATLRASLPQVVTVLATTRGISLPDAVTVQVGAVSHDEATEILARGAARDDELDLVLGDLAETLFHWALLLTLAAAEIHRDDEFGWGLDDGINSYPDKLEPGVLAARAKILRRDFPGDPTMLDDLECIVGSAPPRSVEVLVRRSLDWLGPEHRSWFELLAIYPPGATITPPMLEDLWQTSPNLTRKGIRLLARAGLAQPVRGDKLTIELHDLIAAWLQHEYGRPADSRHRSTHRRLADLCFLPDGTPRKLTSDRAQWLAHHMVSAGDWDKLKALPTLKLRSAFQVATGSDALFLAALDLYGHAARAQAPDSLYHAVRAWLFAAHIRALIGQLPVTFLMAIAVAGDPIAAITQAAQHPRAGEAVPAVLAAVVDRSNIHIMVEHGLAIAGAIPDDQQRGEGLARIAELLVGADPRDPELVERGLAIAGAIPDDQQRGEGLARIAELLVGADPRDPELVERGLAIAGAIPDDQQRGEGLARIAELLVGADPRDPELVERGLAIAGAIPDDQQRGEALALARAAELLVSANSTDSELVRQALAIVQTFSERGRGFVLTAIAGWLSVIVPDRTIELVERALAMAGAISDEWERSRALAGIAELLASTDPRNRWLVERALAIATTIPDKRWHVSALAGIASLLASADPRDAELVERALTIAEAIPESLGRGRALIGIVGQLASADPRDAELVERALAIAETIPSDQERSWTLVGIAELLARADPGDMRLIERALAVIGTIPEDWYRGDALARVAQRLAVIDPARAAELIERALGTAETIPDDWERSRALGGIAELMAGLDPKDPAMIEQALAIAETIPEGSDRAYALAAIAELLTSADPSDAGLIERALAVAGTIPIHSARSRTLARLAKLVTDAIPRNPALIEQALMIAEIIPDDLECRETLTGVAEMVANAYPRDPALIERALAIAKSMADDRQRCHVLAAIARGLAGADREDVGLIERALAIAEIIPASLGRGHALVGIVGQLVGADPMDPRLLERALGVTESISESWSRSEALAGIAGQLALADPRHPGMIEKALAIVETIPDDWPRSEALADIAVRLAVVNKARAAALIDRALGVAETIPIEKGRNFVLIRIAKLLAGADPRDSAMIEQALAVTGTIPSDSMRRHTLAAIAELVANVDPRDVNLIERALAIAKSIPGTGPDRDRALARIAKLLAGADPRDPTMIERALEVAEAISDDQERSRVLIGIVELLADTDSENPALIEHALVVAASIPDNEQRGAAFARIQALTENGMLDELSQWRRRALGASMDLLNVFLGNTPGKMAAQYIGNAILDVAMEFSIRA